MQHCKRISPKNWFIHEVMDNKNLPRKIRKILMELAEHIEDIIESHAK